VWLDEDDMALLGDHGTSVAHNPGSNMRLGGGIADSRAMLERGVNLAIGTHDANCSDNQNMYEAMRLASFASKVRGPDWRRWLSTREAALAATEGGGARALGFEGRIGRIAPGYKADIVMLDLDHPNWLPLNDPVNQLVHTEDGAVTSVIIGGKSSDNRRLVGVDVARLSARAEAARERLAAVNADNCRLYEALEPVVGSHCSGIARLPYHIQRYAAPLE
jgi:5-methylthioadenosine/S-adenosylhomocysteine deaminase